MLKKRGLLLFVVSEPDVITTDAAFILVKNTTTALQHLAAGYRSRFNYPVVGITGSNGKTIVKEWLFELLSTEKRIVRSPKSYNSQVGVPLSVLLMDNHSNLGIFEAGISLPGEMENLARVIQPTIGVITNIGDAHQENFNSTEEKLQEKLKLFTSSRQLVFNADAENTANSIKTFCTKFQVTPISWSFNKGKALIYIRQKKSKGTTSIQATINDNTYEFEISLTDSSSVENACHCFAVLWALTKNPEPVLPGFSKLKPLAMRLEIKKGMNNCLLINDYYNSDLASLSIALSVLQQQAKNDAQKMQVILSDIQQTGIPPHELYLQVNQLLNQWKIGELVGIGPEISAHAGLFSMNKIFYPSTEAFLFEYRRTHFNDSIILIKGARAFTFEKISAALQQKAHQTLLEIDLNALVHNLNTFRNLLRPSTKIMVMVKAFSYGSGDVEIARALQFQNADYLAVAVADEGIELRQAGIHIPIVVMNPEEQSFQNIIDYQLEPNIYNLELLQKFEQAAELNAKNQLPIHIKLDTGMNRLGFKSNEEIEDVINFLLNSTTLKIHSVFSHLAASDDPGFDSFTREQITCFTSLAQKISDAFPYKIMRHILNSAGMERFPEFQMDMVRLGIGLYGVSATSIPLQNISTFRSSVSQIKKAMPGESVGYSRKEVISKETEIAVVPVGYADGLDRKLGNRNGQAFLKGQLVPVIGNICMDMLMLEVTGLNVQPGDAVEFFGPHLSIKQVAEKAGTIPYEILTGISQRVKRVYLYD
jgi:Alr-MurF fusion protein